MARRRHDYNVNIAGGFGGAQFASNYIVVNGIHLPTRRHAYTGDPARRPLAACDGCEAIEWRRQIAARILYS